MRSLLVAAALAALAGPPARAQQGVPTALREIGFDQKLGGEVPLDLRFRDERGRDVALRDYFGARPVVLSLNYYGCPMLCTVTLNGLASALDVLTSFDVGREFEVVTVSFDPKEGPPLAAKKKAQHLGRYKRPTADAGWHFLTGDQAAIDALTKAVGFRYAWDEETRQFAHPAGVVVLTPEGRISRYLYGIEYAPKDLKFALMESARGRIGSFVEQAILYCYRYDPMTGRYSASIMRVMRTGAILTVLGLVAFVSLSLFRERSAPAATEGGR
ncbi:MAG TPA: SCO family protein [Vicinamibacteria bacterium]|nr:SCO family protein [Vicinamibacteria bacterium]